MKLNSLFTYLWRQNCVLCAADAGQSALCTSCLEALPRLSAHVCPICAITVPDGNTSCGSCLQHPPAFEHTWAAYTYSFPLNRLVHTFKYHHQFSLIDTLTQPLIEMAALRDMLPDALLPMPMHPQRLRDRGYNQAHLLAQHLSRSLHIPLLTEACQRTRATIEQAHLSSKQRADNLRGAFFCRAEVKSLRIAIVDDVMTSGSSTQQLALSLREAGASAIECWVIARAQIGET